MLFLSIVDFKSVDMTVMCILYDNQNSVAKESRFFCLLFETKLSLSFVKYLLIGNMVVLFGLGFGY